MASRKQFVAAAAASVGALSAAPALAQSAVAAAPTPTPAPSAAARAFAARMRAFDRHLDDAAIDAIARGVDANWNLGKTIDNRGLALHNADEPLPSFGVRA